MPKPQIIRRYVDAATVAELLASPRAMFTPTGARTVRIDADIETDWYIVPEDDPRLNTIEEIQKSDAD